MFYESYRASKAIVFACFLCLFHFFSAQAATGTIQDVQHVVVLTLENRSFDHYFGCLSGVRGFADRNALVLTNGYNDFYQPNGPNYVLPFRPDTFCLTDVAHDWYGQHQACDGGNWDQWIASSGSSAMIYYTRSDLAFYYALAEAYTICDAYYCPVMGPTVPNRLYQLTGMLDPNGTGGGPVINNSIPPGGFSWITYPERLQGAGVTWRVYQQSNDFSSLNPLSWFAQFKSAQPGNPLYDRGLVLVSNLVAAFQSDVTNGTLPQVSWIIPPKSMSEHPPLAPPPGEILVKQLLDALASNPAVYNSTVFFVTYDENGGFFDHLPSPVPPPGTPNEFVNGWPIGLGCRVPMIIISPWTRGGYVCSQVFDHTSILRFLEQWTGVTEPNISAWRLQVCGDLTSPFDFKYPSADLPSLPTTTQVSCEQDTTPPVPSPQIFPVQELGTRPARPLPYQPNAISVADCAAGRFCITLTNAGGASVHFALYANAGQPGGPWNYDVLFGTSASVCLNVAASGAYDFACYGPNGFQRRFVGNLSTDCNQIEVTSTFDLSAGGIVLTMTNASASEATFTITNGYATGGPWTYNVPPGQSVSDTFSALTNNRGWYDLTATANTDSAFLRRLAGRIENGLPDPLLTDSNPALTAVCSGANLLLSYPAWAGGYALEQTTELFPPSWSYASASSNVINNKIVLTLPISTNVAYFRLRRAY